jgi:hypothetical protein
MQTGRKGPRGAPVEQVAPTHCLGACAVITYLRNEAGAEVLKELIELITTDHHEFDAVERKGHFRFMWLR